MIMFTCPRRVTGVENADYWVNDGAVCSYCGSINPMKFLALVASGDADIVESGSESAAITEKFAEEIKHYVFHYKHFSSNQRSYFKYLLGQGYIGIRTPDGVFNKPFFMQDGYNLLI